MIIVWTQLLGARHNWRHIGRFFVSRNCLATLSRLLNSVPAIAQSFTLDSHDRALQSTKINSTRTMTLECSRPFVYHTLEPVQRPSWPIHLNVHIEFDPGMVGKAWQAHHMTSLRKWSISIQNRQFRKRWQWPQILQFCGDDRLIRCFHVLLRPRLLPYTSLYPQNFKIWGHRHSLRNRLFTVALPGTIFCVACIACARIWSVSVCALSAGATWLGQAFINVWKREKKMTTHSTVSLHFEERNISEPGWDVLNFRLCFYQTRFRQIVIFLKKNMMLLKRGSVTIFSDFLRFFCASKKWWLLAQVSRTSDYDSSVSRANNFIAQAESSKCLFSRAIVVFHPCLLAAIIFPHTKWLPEITDFRDTAALSPGWRNGVCSYLF